MRLLALLLALLVAPLCGCGYRRAVMAEDHFTAGQRALAARSWAAAQREFKAAAAARPRSASLSARIGLAYEQAGRCREAAPWLEDALGAEPRQPAQVPIALVTCLDREGRSRQAERVLREALGTYRRDAIALNNIGYTAADRGAHLEAAEQLLRRAVELKPNAGFILDSLGWCYYQQGKPKQALPLLRRAARSERGDPEILYHLGMVRAALGDIHAAAEQFAAALSLDPTYAPAHDALMALERPGRLSPPAPPSPAPAPPTPAAPLMEQ